MSENKNFHAQDAPSQIGPTLKQARQDLGLTHEDVERVTKIRVRYLEAMERDDYDSLPGIVYAQGFLKTYANYLDLDGEALSRQLKGRRLAQPVNSGGNGASDRFERAGYRGNRPVRFRSPRRRRLSPITIIGAVLGLLLLVILVTGLYFVGLQASRSTDTPEGGSAGAGNEAAEQQDNAAQDPGGEADDDAASEEAAQDEPVPQESGEQDPSGAGEEAADVAPPPEPAPAEPPPPAPPESLMMELRVEGNISWLNVETDGNVVFEQVAQPGFVQTFEAEESITVWSGNAGAVFISVNGQDYGQLGESGQTVIREFTLKSAEN